MEGIDSDKILKALDFEYILECEGVDESLSGGDLCGTENAHPGDVVVSVLCSGCDLEESVIVCWSWHDAIGPDDTVMECDGCGTEDPKIDCLVIVNVLNSR